MLSFREIGYWGRLGNQIFQFSSTFGIASKIGVEAKFPIENCMFNQQTGPYDPALGRNMEVKCELTQCFQIPDDFFIPARHIRTDFVYRENEFTFEERAFLVPDNTAVAGYFQTEKYFSHCEKELREILQFRDEIKESASRELEKIRALGKEIISVHVRRGDYTQSPNHHPPCSLDYYLQAFLHFGKSYSFIIFSDDREWCKNNFSGDNIFFTESLNHFEEMCCMSLCDHHIIANSSFSWWAAWLNTSKNKQIIAPSKWFGPALPKDTRDIYCQGWLKI